MKHKSRYLCFSFCWRQVLFPSQYSSSHPDLPQFSHWRENRRCKARLMEIICMVEVDFSAPTEWKEVFRKVSVAIQFRTPDGITCWSPGVWVLPIPMYFNCCHFFLNMMNCRPPFRDLLIFTTRNGNLLFITAWTLSSFAGRGGFVSFVHISAENWRCWLPATLSTGF